MLQQKDIGDFTQDLVNSPIERAEEKTWKTQPLEKIRAIYLNLLDIFETSIYYRSDGFLAYELHIY